MEVWNEQAVAKSEAVLGELKKFGNFVVIGGWAVWLLTRRVKSLDIDIFVDFNDFYQLQASLIGKGVSVSFNQNLGKYAFELDGIKTDVYTPNACRLPVSCREVFEKKWFDVVEGFKVIKPEPLIVLKTVAERERGSTLKGFKDRCDVLSLLSLDLNTRFLDELLEEHAGLRERLRLIVKNSFKEFEYASQKKLTPREVKLLKQKLLEKLA